MPLTPHTVDTRIRCALLLNIENLVLRARSSSHGFAGQDCELSWSAGVLEYWSVGKNESPNFNLNWSFRYSITPPLHHSSRPPQGGKTVEAASWDSPKPGPLGPNSLLLTTETRRHVISDCRFQIAD